MPVTELGQQGGIGAGLGALIGAAGGYFAGRAAAKDKKYEREHQAAQDALYAQNIQSEIQARGAASQRAATDDANTKYQNGAYQNMLAQLNNPPKGTDIRTWVTHLQKDVLPQSGLTDPKLLGDLMAAAHTAIADAHTQDIEQFQHNLKDDPNAKTPAQKIAYLQKRILAANQHGDTQTAKDANDEIGRIQQGLNQANLERHRGVMEGQGQQHISIDFGRLGQAGVRQAAAAGDPQAFSDVTTRLRKAKTRDQAQAILDSPEGSLLSDRQYTRLQKQVDDTFGSFSKANPKDDTQTRREADFQHATDAIAAAKKTPNYKQAREQIIRAYAAKWGIKYSDAVDNFAQ